MNSDNQPLNPPGPVPAPESAAPRSPEAAAKEPRSSPESPASVSPAHAVGSELKTTRAARGYSLESVCQHTRIPRRFLEALEAGRFDELPAPVYLRSFLKGYCDYLEIEFDPLWQALHPPVPPAAPAHEPGPEPSPAKGTRPATSAAPGPQAATPGSAAQVREIPVSSPIEQSPYFAALGASLGAILVAVALTAALIISIAREHKSELAQEASRPQTLLPLKPVLEPRLSIVLRGDAWISIKADERLLFEGRVPKNAKQEWRAQRILLLRAHPPENLELALNGAVFRLPRPEPDGSYRIESP
ncbi:MAG TPA: hypothetical protein DEB40_04150 [Elusimicrobia bacterium]|nr:hypothetical protein [Elusimicrobiota bacterium]HBT60917.1 hypothetical protein [Elusimicrobiota bacterium]